MTRLAPINTFAVWTCNHGLDEEPERECMNPRMPGSSFCAEHQPVKFDACACGQKVGIRRFLIISRKGIYPTEEDWVCPQCLVNNAPGFEFIEDCTGEDGS